MDESATPREELTDARFGANIRFWRDVVRLSQADLGSQMAERGHPWRQQTVAKVESGERPVRVGEAITLAELLGRDIGDLFLPSQDVTRIRSLQGKTDEVISCFGEAIAKIVRLWGSRSTLEDSLIEMGHAIDTGLISPSERLLQSIDYAAEVLASTRPDDAVVAGSENLGSDVRKLMMQHLPVVGAEVSNAHEQFRASLRAEASKGEGE